MILQRRGGFRGLCGFRDTFFDNVEAKPAHLCYSSGPCNYIIVTATHYRYGGLGGGGDADVPAPMHVSVFSAHITLAWIYSKTSVLSTSIFK
jgi:hypothetical protein